ncbi:hypothetical protein AC579_4670 [Pseudocercospora musae]|uniref:Heat shock protein 70 n=1 Tax=Pseudocercospora musae TaxID=113226 RepID=A0A139I2G8_9PEZI|nr:hypothetical protein AC579_4670 [Pseudocercospora musae]
MSCDSLAFVEAVLRLETVQIAVLNESLRCSALYHVTLRHPVRATTQLRRSGLPCVRMSLRHSHLGLELPGPGPFLPSTFLTSLSIILTTKRHLLTRHLHVYRTFTTVSPIPPMRAGEAVLEVVFEVDVNGILKVTATEKSSGRSANITISNSVGKLGAAEIEKMVEDAAKFKTSDEAFSKKFESRQQLESYISRVEEIVSDPTMSMKLKRGQKEKIEGALSEAMAQLEVEDASSDDLKKKELALKRVVTKAMSTR